MSKNNIKKNEISEFDWTTMNDLFNNGNMKDHLDCKNYISKYFIPTTIGTHVLIENGKPIIIQDATMKTVYLKRFNIDIRKWYNETTIPKKLICDVSKPMLGDKYINVSAQLKHAYQKYDTFNKDTKEKVTLMLEYIKLIWANSNDEVYNYLINWFSNVVKGNKNKSCIYAKGAEGIGKSTLLDFITEYVMGTEITCKGKADHLKGQHNLQLLGKLLVVFEELQMFSEGEWRAIDSELKDLITGDYASYVDKYEKRFDAQNNNNYVVNTNHGAIKSANGRRYLVCDINPTKMNDFDYFTKLRTCFKEIDTTSFKSLEIPITQAKQDICAELISPLEKYLKFELLLKKKALDGKVKQYFEACNQYCVRNGFYKFTSIQKFSQTMRELGLTFKLYNGINTYKISLEELQVLANKKKWLHALDVDECDDDDDDDDDDDEPIKDQSVDIKAEYEKQIKELKQQLFISQHKKDYNELINIHNTHIQAMKERTKALEDIKEEIETIKEIHGIFDDYIF
jgi:hypothetical protein